MRCGDETRRLEQNLIALQGVDIVEYPDNYSNFCQEAVVRAAYIVRRLMNLAYDTTNTPKKTLKRSIGDELGISIICENDDFVEITLPCLLPSRRKMPHDFITGPLYAVLEKFVTDRPEGQYFEPFVHCAICIVHVYDRKLLAKGRKRDNDNIETKAIIDVINTFLLTDDIGIFCDTHYFSEVSDKDSTSIFIMKKEMLSEWIMQRHKMNSQNA
jgi:hypothetical protein